MAGGARAIIAGGRSDRIARHRAGGGPGGGRGGGGDGGRGERIARRRQGDGRRGRRGGGWTGGRCGGRYGQNKQHHRKSHRSPPVRTSNSSFRLDGEAFAAAASALGVGIGEGEPGGEIVLDPVHG